MDINLWWPNKAKFIKENCGRRRCAHKVLTHCVLDAKKWLSSQVKKKLTYTETIKLCPLDVYVCQFLMYEHISFNFLHYKLISFRNVMQLNKIYLIASRAADNSENTSTLKIKSHNIKSLCVHHYSEPFKHIKTSLSKLSSRMLCMSAACIVLTTTTINL